MTPQQPPTYVLIVHVYDRGKGTPQTVQDLKEDWLISQNVTIAIPGADPQTQVIQTGITGYQLPAGTYKITVTSGGYNPNTYSYSVGPNCQPQFGGQCHALVPMTKSTTTP